MTYWQNCARQSRWMEGCPPTGNDPRSGVPGPKARGRCLVFGQESEDCAGRQAGAVDRPQPGPGWQIVVLFLCNCRPAVFLAERLLLIDSLGKPAQLSQKLSQNERRACGDQGASLDSSGSHTVCTKT